MLCACPQLFYTAPTEFGLYTVTFKKVYNAAASVTHELVNRRVDTMRFFTRISLLFLAAVASISGFNAEDSKPENTGRAVFRIYDYGSDNEKRQVVGEYGDKKIIEEFEETLFEKMPDLTKSIRGQRTVIPLLSVSAKITKSDAVTVIEAHASCCGFLGSSMSGGEPGLLFVYNGETFQLKECRPLFFFN